MVRSQNVNDGYVVAVNDPRMTGGRDGGSLPRISMATHNSLFKTPAISDMATHSSLFKTPAISAGYFSNNSESDASSQNDLSSMIKTPSPPTKPAFPMYSRHCVSPQVQRNKFADMLKGGQEIKNDGFNSKGDNRYTNNVNRNFGNPDNSYMNGDTRFRNRDNTFSNKPFAASVYRNENDPALRLNSPGSIELHFDQKPKRGSVADVDTPSELRSPYCVVANVGEFNQLPSCSDQPQPLSNSYVTVCNQFPRPTVTISSVRNVASKPTFSRDNKSNSYGSSLPSSPDENSQIIGGNYCVLGERSLSDDRLASEPTESAPSNYVTVAEQPQILSKLFTHIQRSPLEEEPSPSPDNSSSYVGAPGGVPHGAFGSRWPQQMGPETVFGEPVDVRYVQLPLYLRE